VVSIAAYSDRRDALSLSRDQGDQEVSVTASNVGRQALSSLLKHANADANMTRRKSTRRNVSENAVASRKAPPNVESKKGSKDQRMMGFPSLHQVLAKETKKRQ
jgi:hypothetical protein